MDAGALKSVGAEDPYTTICRSASWGQGEGMRMEEGLVPHLPEPCPPSAQLQNCFSQVWDVVNDW